MTRVSIDLPDDLSRKVAARAAESGHGSIEEYVESLLRSDAEGEADAFGGPDALHVENDEELERLLLSRVGGGQPVEATPEFWQSFRNRLASKGARKP